ncbi:MAG: hypothetical protein EBS19_05060 [Spirochaetia bacterium]|nr:hypothetical protein [Spirochaetia bacterium]
MLNKILGVRMSHLKIKSKLLVMFFSVTVPSILTIGGLGYLTGKSSLSSTIFNQLTSIRSTKAYQIKTYFHNMRAQVDTLSESKMLISATKDFSLAFSNLKNNSISDEVILKNENFYKNIIKAEYDKKNSEDFNVNQFLPKSKETNLLQYEYISNNPYPIGEKEKLMANKYLSKRQWAQMKTEAEMIWQFAQFLGKEESKNGRKNFGITTEAFVSLNGHPAKQMIDPNIDLLSVKLENFSFPKWVTLDDK